MTLKLLKQTLFSLFVVASLSGSPAAAATPVGGPILTNTTWNLAGSPYCVVSSVIVGGGATLTIDAGVQVQMGDNFSISVGSSVFGPGTLVADGTVGNPITISGSSWNDLLFDDTAVDASFTMTGAYAGGCLLRHCFIQGGGSSGMGTLRITRSSPFLEHVSVLNSQSDGAVIDHAASPEPPPMRIEGCRFDSNLARGLEVTNGNSHQIVDSFATANSEVGFHVSSAPNVKLDGCEARDNAGGGYYLQSCTNALLVDLVARGNGVGSSSVQGAGVYLSSCSGSTIESGCFIDNRSGSVGGGISMTSSSNSTISDCVFRGNTSLSNAGGNAYLSSQSNLVIDRCEFSGGTAASSGGGVYWVSGSGSLTDSLIEDNTANQTGGGIYAVNASLSLVRVSISRNESTGDGGGLDLQNGGTNTFVDCIVTSNRAGEDGGGVNVRGPSLTVTGTTFALNDAVGYGGGLMADNSSTVKLAATPASFNRFACNSAGIDGANVANLNPLQTNGTGNIDATGTDWNTTNPATIISLNYDFFKNSALAIVGISTPAAVDPIFDLAQGSELLGGPQLDATGSLVAGSPATIHLNGFEPQSTSLLVAGLGVSNTPFLDTTIVPSFQILTALPIPAGGSLTIPVNWPSGAPMGQKFVIQSLNASASAANGVATVSNALLLVQP